MTSPMQHIGTTEGASDEEGKWLCPFALIYLQTLLYLQQQPALMYLVLDTGGFSQ